jgi:hypothetical protein
MNFEKEGMNCLVIILVIFLEEEIEEHLKSIDSNINLEEIDFEKFARLVAILLEELNNPSKWLCA